MSPQGPNNVFTKVCLENILTGYAVFPKEF